MKVIDINTLKEIEVPDDYIRCSVCKQYHPKSSYVREGETHQSRTNCYDCYMLQWDDMEELKKKTDTIMKSTKYQSAVIQLEQKLNLFGMSMSVSEMIEALLKLNPNDRIYIGQEGYYADGKYADIYLPSEAKEVDGMKFYEIGYSCQNY